MKQYNRSGCPDSTGQQHIPYVEGRVDSVDNGIFIHAIVPRHVETVVLLSKGEVDSNMYQRSELDYLICNDPMGYADLVLNGNPGTYLKTVTEYKPLDS